MSGDHSKPWHRWRRGHWGGHPRGTTHKIIHYFRIFAEWQAYSLSQQRTSEYDVYPCRWGDNFQDGETHRLHWHVGRKPKEDSP